MACKFKTNEMKINNKKNLFISLKPRYIFLFSIALVLFSLSSCCNKATESAKYYLSDNEKSFIPYVKDQSVLFVHSNGHEFEMNVFNVFTQMTRTFTEHCNEDYISYEYMVSEMSSMEPQLYISLMVTPEEYSPYLLITVNNDNFKLLTTTEPEIDSISIGGYTFTDVYELKNNIVDTTIIQPETVLYNKSYGVLQIKLTNDESFDYIP